MTGKEITDAALDYAYAAGKLAAKLEAYNRDVEEFLATYEMGSSTTEDQTRLRPQTDHEVRKMRRNVRPVICSPSQTAADTDAR